MRRERGDIHQESRINWRFSFTKGIKVAQGEDCSVRAAPELEALGCESVLLVVDPNADEAGAADAAIDSLKRRGIAYHRFDDIEPDPDEETVHRGVEIVEAENLDGILAVGGGSTTDAGKAISLAATNDGPIGGYEGVDTFESDPLPCVAVPTTVGTGSAISQGMVITKGGRKRTMVDERVAPDVALFDPLLLTTLPKPVRTSTGFDALAQAIESYISTRSNPVSEALALRAVGDIADNLRPAIVGSNPAALASLQEAAIVQALAFTNSGLGLAHGMSNTVGSYFDTPHGLTTAVVLPHVLRFNLVAVPEKYVDLVSAIRGERPAGIDVRGEAELLVEECERFNNDLGVPDGLRELGVEQSATDEMAACAVDHLDSLGNPRTFTESDVEELFEQAY